MESNQVNQNSTSQRKFWFSSLYFLASLTATGLYSRCLSPSATMYLPSASSTYFES